VRSNSSETFSFAGEVIFAILLLAKIATHTGACVAQDRTVKVTLSNAMATTSENVQIKESTEMLADHIVTGIKRDTKRIGIYHRELKRFVLWNGYLTRGEKQNTLPKGLIVPHGIPLKDFGGGRVGVQYDFNTPDPGVFIVNTEWTLRPRAIRDAGVVVRTGNPVLLFVEPAADHNRPNQSNDNIIYSSSLQEILEREFDANPDEVGVLLPKLN